MANLLDIQPGQAVLVIDPEDGYYLRQGEVAAVRGQIAYVRFQPEDEEERFRLTQLRLVRERETQE